MPNNNTLDNPGESFSLAQIYIKPMFLHEIIDTIELFHNAKTAPFIPPPRPLIVQTSQMVSAVKSAL